MIGKIQGSVGEKKSLVFWKISWSKLHLNWDRNWRSSKSEKEHSIIRKLREVWVDKNIDYEGGKKKPDKLVNYVKKFRTYLKSIKESLQNLESDTTDQRSGGNEQGDRV